MSTLILTCPLDGLSLATVVLDRIGLDSHVDGDFIRDPGQHVHYPINVAYTCLNGHRWRCEADLVLQRVRPLA